MIDHFVGAVSVGPQIGLPGAPTRTGIAPLFYLGGGIAEEGEASLRILGGVEWSIGTPHPRIELVPSVFGGFLKQFDRDEREGPMLKVGLGVRFVGDENFYIVLEPISFVLLPAPPSGFTPYTTHFAAEATLVRMGGRLPGGF